MFAKRGRKGSKPSCQVHLVYQGHAAPTVLAASVHGLANFLGNSSCVVGVEGEHCLAIEQEGSLVAMSCPPIINFIPPPSSPFKNIETPPPRPSPKQGAARAVLHSGVQWWVGTSVDAHLIRIHCDREKDFLHNHLHTAHTTQQGLSKPQTESCDHFSGGKVAFVG